MSSSVAHLAMEHLVKKPYLLSDDMNLPGPTWTSNFPGVHQSRAHHLCGRQSLVSCRVDGELGPTQVREWWDPIRVSLWHLWESL